MEVRLIGLAILVGSYFYKLNQLCTVFLNRADTAVLKCLPLCSHERQPIPSQLRPMGWDQEYTETAGESLKEVTWKLGVELCTDFTKSPVLKHVTVMVRSPQFRSVELAIVLPTRQLTPPRCSPNSAGNKHVLAVFYVNACQSTCRLSAFYEYLKKKKK